MLKLSDAQWKALEKIAQPGGHGYGEYAHLSRATAKALAKKGLVTLGYRPSGVYPGRRPHAEITDAGRALLKQRQEARGWGW